MPVYTIDVIKPRNNGAFPITEDIDNKGGWRVVSSLVDRDAIPMGRRKAGMQVRVVATNKVYALIGGIDNINWAEPNIEITPTALASVPAGVDGQLAVVTDPRESRVFVRSGGNLLPIHEEYNTDIITMRVDPVGGTTPPAGTIVHNQAEYTALGYDLKLIQDAINIMPPIWNWTVKINLASGTHLAKALALGNAAGGSRGNAVIALDFPGSTSKHQPFMYGLGLATNNGGSIEIVGESDTIIQASTAGSTAGYVLTRTDVGTWTPNEHRGRFVYIDSGVGAGQKAVIESNDATTLRVVAWTFSPAGVCTFQIMEPAAVLLPSTDGVTKNSTFMVYINGLTRQRFYFKNVKFGNAAMSGSSLVLGGFCQKGSVLIGGSGFYFYYCVAELTALPGGNYPLQTNTLCSAVYSSFKVGGPYGSVIWGGVFMLNGSLFYGSTPSAPDYRSLSAKLNAYDGGTIYLAGATVETTDDHECLLVYNNTDIWLSSSGLNRIIGNGNNTGIAMYAKQGGILYADFNALLDFVNNNQALSLHGTARADLSDVILSGANNTTAWEVSEGAFVVVSHPELLVATTNEVKIDNTVLTYAADFPAAGTLVEGALGSKFLRRV